MIAHLSLAYSQLSDPATRGVLWKSILAAAILLAVLWVGAWFAIAQLSDWLGASAGAEGGWIDWLVAVLATVAGLTALIFASFLLFPPLMTAIMSIFLEEVAAAVEASHYPALPAAREQPVFETVKNGLSLAGAQIALNVVILPLYLFLLPPFNFFVFYALNGYLLGREYFELVAVRRLPRAEVKAMRQRHRFRLIAVGAIIALLLTIPIVNLVTPIVATAFMLHVFEGLRRRSTGGD